MTQAYRNVPFDKNNSNYKRLLTNAQAALLSGYLKRFNEEPDTEAVIDASENAARLVAGGEDYVPEWQVIDRKRRIVWI